jgi:hypothetical protein
VDDACHPPLTARSRACIVSVKLTMCAATPSSPVAKAQRNADRKSNAGATPDPWEACVKIEYGGDRSFAWSVREELIATPRESWPQAEERLLKALALPGGTEAGRAFVCQMLAMIGTAKSVPALAGLLKETKFTESARYALEAIPGPEASTALRDGLGFVEGRAKAGMIGSIAVRGDTSARYSLAAIKGNPSEPAIVREAAARALEHLANARA